VFQGAGTVSKNLTVGGSGTTPTLNVGDAGKAGLLSITGAYTQLSTGTMTGLINGTTAGTGFSQLKVTGAATLAGTINFTVATGFQGSLTLGETFTVLNAASITGSFSNSTIAINSSFHFTVTYTSTGVVLTVASGPVSAPSAIPAQPVAQMAMTTTKTIVSTSKSAVSSSGLRYAASGIVAKTAKPILVAGAPWKSHSNAILARGSELTLRSWERVPAISANLVRPVSVAPVPRVANNSSRVALPNAEPRLGQSHLIGVQAPLAGWIGTSSTPRVPVKILSPMLPRIVR